MSNWTCQYFTTFKFGVGTPKFKGCKLKKETFSEVFSDVWYKHPYKYQLQVEVSERIENLKASIELVYEDGTKISSKQELITQSEGLFEGTIATIGPFQFNCCSYKQENRKFRLVVSLSTTTPLCCLISSPFTIKAKKPIIRPGIKRKHEEEEEVTKPKEKRDNKVESLIQDESKNLDNLDFDFDDMDKAWELVEPPIEECFNMYRVMSIEDKKRMLEKILDGATFAERELILSKLVKVQIIPTENQTIDKYFTDFGDLNF